MMNCFQYQMVCQVKQDVQAIISHIQSATFHVVHRGLPIPVIPHQYVEKLQYLQDVLYSNQILPEHFDLSRFAGECLRDADQQVVDYLNFSLNKMLTPTSLGIN